MRDDITAGMKAAMKAQDKRRVSTLRLIMAAIKDRDVAARGAGHERISDDEILDVLAKMIKQRRESVQNYEEGGRAELAQQENEEIEIIQEFLPRQLDERETQAAIDAVIEDIGAAGLKDMGRTMAALKERYANQIDFSKAGPQVKERLKD
ncbi:MAG: GatB/YqeY domain-containing protein [Pseudomonadota bacterium]